LSPLPPKIKKKKRNQKKPSVSLFPNRAKGSFGLQNRVGFAPAENIGLGRGWVYITGGWPFPKQ